MIVHAEGPLRAPLMSTAGQTPGRFAACTVIMRLRGRRQLSPGPHARRSASDGVSKETDGIVAECLQMRQLQVAI
jgi:hypothetical protein